MTLWRIAHLQTQVDQISATFGQQLRTSISPSFFVQWIVVGAVGLGLGIYTVAASYLPLKWTIILVLAALCPFGLVIVGNVRKWLLAIIILDTSFQADVHLFYRTEVESSGTLGGLNISVTTLALVVLYALWLGKLLTGLETRPVSLVRMSLPLASYLAFAVLSVGVARDVTLSMFEIFLFLQMFLLYLYIIGTVRTRQEVLFIVMMLLISLLGQSLLIIAVYLTKQDFSLGGIISTHTNSAYTTGEQWRPGGTFGSPNSAASFLSLLLAPVLSILFTRLGRSYKWLAVLTFGLGTIALLLTLSRGGWVAFALSVILLCLLAWHRGWLSLTVPLASVIIVMFLFLFFQDVISTRLSGDDDGSAQSRFPLMQLAFRMIEDNPVLGVGANNFGILIRQYATLGVAGAWLYTVHNKYLLIWAETGIGGLMAFMWFLGATLQRGWRSWQSSDRFLSLLALGFTVAIVGHMTQMFVEPFRGRLEPQLLWLIAGLITAIYSMVGVTAEKKETIHLSAGKGQ